MTTLDELELFRGYAVHELRDSDTDCSLEELLGQWRAMRERDEVNEAIRESLQDISEGRTVDAETVFAEAYGRLSS